MERRVLLAIVLSFLVLYAYQTLVVKPVPKSATGPSAPPGARMEGPSPAPVSPSEKLAAAPPAEAAAPAANPLLGDSRDRDVRIENRDIIVVLTNRGARL